MIYDKGHIYCTPLMTKSRVTHLKAVITPISERAAVVILV